MILVVVLVITTEVVAGPKSRPSHIAAVAMAASLAAGASIATAALDYNVHPA